MRTDKNILIAFILNLAFSVFEFIGGAICGSVAIISDAIHDIGDAASIGISYFLEVKSKKKPDKVYTYGYLRYSVMGGLITTVILLFGSLMVIYNAVIRVFSPVEIHYDSMIVFAIIGAAVNLVAAWFTGKGDSINQKAVNLHMLEDVLGWIVVLLGAIIMKFTDIAVIDPIMSIGVALFIIVNALKNLIGIINLFLEKIPDNVKIDEIKEHICAIDGVKDIHHIHVRSLDGYNTFITMHVVTDEEGSVIKQKIREELQEHNICHATLELETTSESCGEKECSINSGGKESHHHHHHHHH